MTRPNNGLTKMRRTCFCGALKDFSAKFCVECYKRKRKTNAKDKNGKLIKIVKRGDEVIDKKDFYDWGGNGIYC